MATRQLRSFLLGVQSGSTRALGQGTAQASSVCRVPPGTQPCAFGPVEGVVSRLPLKT